MRRQASIGILTVAMAWAGFGLGQESPLPRPAAGIYSLAEFGAIQPGAAARETYERAGAAILERGGGLLVLPPGTAPDLEPRNHWGPALTRWQNVDLVAVLDLRYGTPALNLPQQGNPVNNGWAGLKLRRIQDSPFVYWPWTPSKMLHAYQAVVRGGSSVLRNVETVPVGEVVRIYPETIRGIFPNQHLGFRTLGVTPARQACAAAALAAATAACILATASGICPWTTLRVQSP